MLRQKRGPCRLAMLVCLGAGLGAALAGCKKGLDLVPVAGKVFYKGEPVPRGGVSFVPDEDKGNTSRHLSRGVLGPEGDYELFTNGQRGAPPGPYKVAVGTIVEKTRPPKTLTPLRYMDPKKSGLAVEVRRDAPAGSYDLHLEP